MALAAGTCLGPYELQLLIGAGGMGEVYRARDIRLDRTVAVKTLPPALSIDPDRRARFEREAKAIGALNHPNICTLHDVGEDRGTIYLVMEHLAGEPLSARLRRGPLPVVEALRLGAEIAAALAAAHRAGIVHRDLKPANVMLVGGGRSASGGSGTAKVLDFGLAKLTGHGETPAVAFDAATTETATLTGRGTILGTLPYMAPEQLQGERSDARTDIWALGAILYEMATGLRAFDAGSAPSVVAAILATEPPPLTARVPQAPPAFERTVRRCLAKHPDDRWASAHDIAEELHGIAQELEPLRVVQAARRWPLRRVAASPGVIAGLAALVTIVSLLALRPARTPSFVESLERARLRNIRVSETQMQDPAMSPDGKLIAYVAKGADGQVDLYAMRVSGGEPVRLTSDLQEESSPRFSPDGERLVFTRRDLATGVSEVRLMPALGGQAIAVVARAMHAAWSPDGSRIAFLRRMHGGEPMALITSRPDGSEQATVYRADGTYPFMRGLAWAPGGEEIAVVRSTGGAAGEIWLVSLGDGKARRLSEDQAALVCDEPSFTPDGRGVLHRSNRGGAMNLWFLPVGGGTPTRITTGPGPDMSPSLATDGRVLFLSSHSRTALLAYSLATAQSRVLVTHTTYLWGPAFSPDGQEVAFSRGDIDGSWQLWTVRIDGSSLTQVAASETGALYPRYTPDGEWLVFNTWKLPHAIVRVRRTGGELAPLSTSDGAGDGYADVSPDGRTLVFARSVGGAEGIFTAPMAGGPATRLSSMRGSVPRWSPDGRWVAFGADRSLAGGIYIVGADGTGERRLLATGGWPVWWPDGRHIGYMRVAPSGAEELNVLSLVDGSNSVITGLHHEGSNNPFDISRDGSMIVTSTEQHVLSELWVLEPDAR